MKKKLFTGLLILALLFTMLPAGALAADETANETAEATYTDGSGKQVSGSLSDAIYQAADKSTVTLNRDVVLEGYIYWDDAPSRTLTLDGKGHTIKPASPYQYENESWALIYVLGGDESTPGNQLTIKNVTVDALQKCRILECGQYGALTIESGVTLKNGVAAGSYTGGVSVVDHAKLTMKGGAITGNKGDEAYTTGGRAFMAYADDMIIGVHASAVISGGTAGRVLVRANDNWNSPADGGYLTLQGGTIEDLFVEAQASREDQATTLTGGKVKTLRIARDYYDTASDNGRVVFTAENLSGSAKKPIKINGLEIPEGLSMTAANGNLFSSLTIGKDAALTIPEGTTVYLKAASAGPDTGKFPVITNQGTLRVNGSLIAGDSAEDAPGVQIEGSGKVETGAKGVLDEGNPDAPAPAAETPAAAQTFADVPATEWYNKAVSYVSANGIMAGSNGRFSPNARLTRGAMAQILYNMEKAAAGGAATFPDVAASDWFASAASWASDQGFMSGYSNGRFGPNDAITREQLAAILYRYVRTKGYDVTGSAELGGFSDGASTSDWAEAAVRWAVGAGLLSGKTGIGGDRLDPLGTATRAEVAQILQNLSVKISK